MGPRQQDDERRSAMLEAVPLPKRRCLSPRASPQTTSEPDASDLTHLLHMSPDEIWSLPKAELRQYFLKLQTYARSSPAAHKPAPIPPPPRLVQTELPPFLLLPAEIRNCIYAHLLSPPASTQIRGPHPRQLQQPLSLSRAFSPAILRVSRQICLEALPVFYGNPAQVIHITIDYNVWTHKVQRSPLLMGHQTTSAFRHIHINIHLGNEKKMNRPEREDAEARLAVVRKGARKVGKWLGGGNVKMLRISWHEPPQTYVWEQKKVVLDELRVLRAESVTMGVLNWNLNYRGKPYQFKEEYLKDLQRDATTPPAGKTDIGVVAL